MQIIYQDPYESLDARFRVRQTVGEPMVVHGLGKIVDQGPAHEVVRNPRHPYTNALLSVVSRRDPRSRTTPQVLAGETATQWPFHRDAASTPAARRFAPLLPMELPSAARRRSPLLAEAGPRHSAACHLTCPAHAPARG